MGVLSASQSETLRLLSRKLVGCFLIAVWCLLLKGLPWKASWFFFERERDGDGGREMKREMILRDGLERWSYR